MEKKLFLKKKIITHSKLKFLTKIEIKLIIIFFTFFSFSYSQHYTELLSKRIVDKPLGLISEANCIYLNSEIFFPGGLLIETYYGANDWFTFGLSFGGNNIVGYNKIYFNEYPGLYSIFEIFKETSTYPSICLGFDTQGYGYYYDKYNRYQILPPGIFVTFSKFLDWNGKVIISFGINRSINFFEKVDKYRKLNSYFAIQKNIGNWFLFNFEYDFAFNDNIDEYFGQSKGYLNLGITLRLFNDKNMNFKFNLKDLLRNSRIDGKNRTLGISYFWSL